MPRISSSVRSPMPVPASMRVSLSTSKEVVRKAAPMPPLQPRILMLIVGNDPADRRRPLPESLTQAIYMVLHGPPGLCDHDSRLGAQAPARCHAMQFIGTATLDLCLYLLAALGLLLRLLRIGPTMLRESRGFCLSAAVAAVFIHSVLLYGLLFTDHGLDLGYFNALALTGWLMALIALAASLKPAFENLGLVLYPLAGLCVLAA